VIELIEATQETTARSGLAGLSFDRAARGCLYGLLGPNGAGKGPLAPAQSSCHPAGPRQRSVGWAGSMPWPSPGPCVNCSAMWPRRCDRTRSSRVGNY